MFCQFTTNLNALRSSDDPEVVHQARSAGDALKVRCGFQARPGAEAVPSWQPCKRCDCLGELRDLDVAQTDTLPPLADAYTQETPGAQKYGRR